MVKVSTPETGPIGLFLEDAETAPADWQTGGRPSAPDAAGIPSGLTRLLTEMLVGQLGSAEEVDAQGVGVIVSSAEASEFVHARSRALGCSPVRCSAGGAEPEELDWRRYRLARRRGIAIGREVHPSGRVGDAPDVGPPSPRTGVPTGPSAGSRPTPVEWWKSLRRLIRDLLLLVLGFSRPKASTLAASPARSAAGSAESGPAASVFVDAIVALPRRLFPEVDGTFSLWIIRRPWSDDVAANRRTLFIDASKLGRLTVRRRRELAEGDISRIMEVYRAWRREDTTDLEVPGFCSPINAAELEDPGFAVPPVSFVLAEETSRLSRSAPFWQLAGILLLALTFMVGPAMLLSGLQEEGVGGTRSLPCQATGANEWGRISLADWMSVWRCIGHGLSASLFSMIQLGMLAVAALLALPAVERVMRERPSTAVPEGAQRLLRTYERGESMVEYLMIRARLREFGSGSRAMSVVHGVTWLVSATLLAAYAMVAIALFDASTPNTEALAAIVAGPFALFALAAAGLLAESSLIQSAMDRFEVVIDKKITVQTLERRLTGPIPVTAHHPRSQQAQRFVPRVLGMLIMLAPPIAAFVIGVAAYAIADPNVFQQKSPSSIVKSMVAFLALSLLSYLLLIGVRYATITLPARLGWARLVFGVMGFSQYLTVWLFTCAVALQLWRYLPWPGGILTIFFLLPSWWFLWYRPRQGGDGPKLSSWLFPTALITARYLAVTRASLEKQERLLRGQLRHIDGPG